MTTTSAIAIGSRWRLKRGQHAGSIVQIVSAGGATVRYRNLGGGKSVGSTPYDDEAKPHTRPREEFLTLFEPATSGGATGTAVAFRRTYQPKEEEAVTDTAPALAPQSHGKNGTHYVSDGGTGLGIAIETITPEMAQTWLDRSANAANRKPSERRVLQLMNAIQMGEWQLTGDSIKLDATGLVRDGKHRLTAISRSGRPVQALVVRGVNEAAFDVIDTGKNRSASDVLAIHGHANTIATATAARGLILLERFGRLSVGSVKIGYVSAPTNATVLAYVETHPEVAEGVHMADRLRIQGRFVGGSGLWAIPCTLFYRVNAEQAEVFVHSLIEGANLEQGSPILRLAKMYTGARDWQGTGENRERLVAVAIKAWNFWRRDELVQTLVWRDSGRGAEKFPMPE